MEKKLGSEGLSSIMALELTIAQLIEVAAVHKKRVLETY
jgi:hypothetical protein